MIYIITYQQPGISAALSAHTSAAQLNGLLRHSYQVQVCGVSYRDLAAAYQAHKDGENDIRTMTLLLQKKLEQHIELFDAIEDRGGLQWLETCEYADGSAFWQGIGQDSAYIRCLISAYEQVCCNLYLTTKDDQKNQ